MTEHDDRTEYTTPFVAAKGGVMTDDAGVITGELELRTTLEPGGVVLVRVRYAGAKDWYRIRAADCTLHDERDLRGLHNSLIGILNRPIWLRLNVAFRWLGRTRATFSPNPGPQWPPGRSR